MSFRQHLAEYTYHNGDDAYTRSSVEAALAIHQREGRIRQWSARHDGRHVASSRRNPQYTVILFNQKCITLKDVHEAHVFTMGLASAVQADSAKRAAEEAAHEAYEAASQARKAAENEREQLAILVAKCPTCGSEEGVRCVREPADATPWAAHPHAPRLDLAGVTVTQAKQEVFSGGHQG